MDVFRFLFYRGIGVCTQLVFTGSLGHHNTRKPWHSVRDKAYPDAGCCINGLEVDKHLLAVDRKVDNADRPCLDHVTVVVDVKSYSDLQ